MLNCKAGVFRESLRTRERVSHACDQIKCPLDEELDIPGIRRLQPNKMIFQQWNCLSHVCLSSDQSSYETRSRRLRPTIVRLRVGLEQFYAD